MKSKAVNFHGLQSNAFELDKTSAKMNLSEVFTEMNIPVYSVQQIPEQYGSSSYSVK